MLSLGRKKEEAWSSTFICLHHFGVTLFITTVLSYFIHPIWIKSLDLYHTGLEVTCVFIALAAFMAVWFTYSKRVEVNYILGIGYLAVAIFDILHAYFHLRLNLNIHSYFDLSSRYWILGRMSEALMMLFAAKGFKLPYSRFKSLILLLVFTLGAAYFVNAYHDLLPVLLTASGVTPLKIVLEYVIISIYLYSLFCLRNKLDQKDTVTYKHLFIALLMSVASEVCFTLYSSIMNISWTIGHVLKITSYFYLFRGIFISTITYPYSELEEKNEKLEALNLELSNMSANMSKLLDAMPIAVLKYDGQGELEYVNKKFAELLEYDREELLTARGRALEKETGVIYYHNEGSSGHIKAYTARSGKPVKLSQKVHELGDGKLVLLNETKKEQELRNLHIQTETIFASISNGVLVMDEDKKIVLYNKAFKEILEMDCDELLGSSINTLNEMVNYNMEDLAAKTLRDELDVHEYQAKLTSLKGSEKELQVYVAPIRNIDGEIIGVIAIITDITEHKKELQRMMQQEKLALLGQMGASIVHETRNFLTTIKGRCQLIDMMCMDESIKRHAAKINSDVEEVNRIISEFLFLSKPRDTEFYEISIHDVFASIRSMVETSSLVKGVDIEFLFTEEERYILCDEAQLKQVILNICKNAIDAMSGRENAMLLIETGYVEDSNEMYISISDNGKGISEEDLKKLGTPFFTTKSNGTGLGLSVCFKIVQEHGGRIEIDSTVGEGTTFKIILPCIEEEDTEEYLEIEA